MHLPHTHPSLRIQNKENATPNPASESPSGEGTRNVPRLDCSLIDDPKCLDASLNFFFINFFFSIHLYHVGFSREFIA
ncbi:hypothetical protein E2C01_034978 [Portunus trituberculatus]|uniref:Uncharacterized protein n=1 Tax=Portunus trituberculatus TaxID=210409 RepID=A0A5B7F8F2_PORTR|nr:hypothetical protein [Portunus trituberculatus]